VAAVLFFFPDFVANADCCNPVVEDFGDISCCRVKKREGELRLVIVVLLWSFDLDLWRCDASEVDIVDKVMGV
jgi:hypothetical protein